jgi:hypothetical protein
LIVPQRRSATTSAAAPGLNLVQADQLGQQVLEANHRYPGTVGRAPGGDAVPQSRLLLQGFDNIGAANTAAIESVPRARRPGPRPAPVR